MDDDRSDPDGMLRYDMPDHDFLLEPYPYYSGKTPQQMRRERLRRAEEKLKGEQGDETQRPD